MAATQVFSAHQIFVHRVFLFVCRLPTGAEVSVFDICSPFEELQQQSKVIYVYRVSYTIHVSH